MMKRFFPILSLVIALFSGGVIGWSVCWLQIRENQEYQAIEEAKLCYLNLEKHSSEMSPQLREYLKARLYSAAANYINEGWLDGWNINFGPADDKVLSPIYAIKNASDTEDIYKAALQRHPRSAKKNISGIFR